MQTPPPPMMHPRVKGTAIVQHSAILQEGRKDKVHVFRSGRGKGGIMAPVGVLHILGC